MKLVIQAAQQIVQHLSGRRIDGLQQPGGRARLHEARDADRGAHQRCAERDEGELEDRLRRDCSSFHSGDFGKLDNFPAAVVQAGELKDDIYGRGGLFTQGPFR